MELKLFGKCIYISKFVLVTAILAAALLMGTVGLVLSTSGKGVIFDIGSADDSPGGSAAMSAGGGGAGAAGTGGEGAAGAGSASGGSGAGAAENGEVSGAPGTGAVGVSDAGSASNGEEIKVYVVGCVKNPGIVTLKKGQLIDDAIKAAGGVTADADIENINMVYRLDDNVMLKIRSKKEGQQASQSAEVKPSAKPPANASAKPSGTGTGAVIVTDSGGAMVEDTTEAGKGGGKININTASVDELDTLPYIGKETAKDIIAFRQSTGKFKVIEDIMKVPGIKESRFGKIKDLICVN